MMAVASGNHYKTLADELEGGVPLPFSISWGREEIIRALRAYASSIHEHDYEWWNVGQPEYTYMGRCPCGAESHANQLVEAQS